jgi:hypothetical protein
MLLTSLEISLRQISSFSQAAANYLSCSRAASTLFQLSSVSEELVTERTLSQVSSCFQHALKEPNSCPNSIPRQPLLYPGAYSCKASRHTIPPNVGRRSSLTISLRASNTTSHPFHHSRRPFFSHKFYSHLSIHTSCIPRRLSSSLAWCSNLRPFDRRHLAHRYPKPLRTTKRTESIKP